MIDRENIRNAAREARRLTIENSDVIKSVVDTIEKAANKGHTSAVLYLTTSDNPLMIADYLEDKGFSYTHSTLEGEVSVEITVYW